MQEYRPRLAADVVTGKLDVRPAAPLPNVPAESTREAGDANDPDEATDNHEK